MRSPVAGALALSITAAVTLGATLSCNVFDIPAGTCDPNRVIGMFTSTGEPDPRCAGCLEGQCCDDVGFCLDEEGCSAAVSDMQACVLATGRTAAAEATCVSRLGGRPRARKAYQCMRERCGEQCALPSCRIDTAAALFVNAECDSCFTGACCPELNACYRNRTCKLILECITKECTDVFGAVLGIGPAGEQIVKGAAEAACTRNEQPPAALAEGPGRCIGDCFNRFALYDESGTVDPAQGGLCLSTTLYACGLRSGCSDRCRLPSNSGDSGADAR